MMNKMRELKYKFFDNGWKKSGSMKLCEFVNENKGEIKIIAISDSGRYSERSILYYEEMKGGIDKE